MGWPPRPTRNGGPVGSGKTTLVERLCKALPSATTSSTRTGLAEVIDFIETKGLLEAAA